MSRYPADFKNENEFKTLRRWFDLDHMKLCKKSRRNLDVILFEDNFVEVYDPF